MEIESRSYLITLPLVPSHQGRENELLDRLFIPTRELAGIGDYCRRKITWFRALNSGMQTDHHLR